MPGKPKTDNKLGDSLEPVFKAVEDYMREVTKLYGMPQEGDKPMTKAQREALFYYYTKYGMKKEANALYEEDAQ